MKKSIAEHLLDLEEPHRSKALKNYKERPIKEIDGFEFEDPGAALFHAFIWNETLEGPCYWYELYKTLT